MVAMKAIALGLAVLAKSAFGVVLEGTSDTTMRVLSKAEIMATMTNEKALAVALNNTNIRSRPELMAILKEFKKVNGTVATDRKVAAHRGGQDPPKGYAAVEGAKNLLNEMMDDAMAKLDNKVETCGTYNRETLIELEQMRQDVASFNSQAAEARGRVLKAQGTIAFCNLKMPQVQEELDEHNAECIRQETALNTQIDIVLADLDVMSSILDIIGDCEASKAAALIQCRHCRKTGNGYVMLQDNRVQALVDKLKSSEAREALQKSLGELYKESSEQEEPVALTQMQVTKLRGSRQTPDDPEWLMAMGNESDDLNISAVPEETLPASCVPTNKCTLSKGSCTKIRDRMLNIQTGIQDLYGELKDQLAELLNKCETNRIDMENQLANLGEKLRTAQTDLGIATKDQVDAESASNLKGQQHEATSNTYGKTMNECCVEQNNLKSEICALEKIRGELLKLKGVDMFITDCEVSNFKAGKCSVSCGGGSLIKTRSVLVHPVNGMACPPLELKESCNTHPCPIDCVLGEWEGWSGCSADCGGGLRERMRPVLQEMKYDGAPCEDTEASEACNSESCNANCELGQWDDWGACTQACWGGTSRRDRPVATPARGTGKCPAPTDESRLKFRKCNNIPCKQFYHREGRKNFLKCGSKADIIILMDGSGSLGNYGWRKSKQFVENLVKHLEGGEDYVRVALQVFSGPVTWSAYKRCTGLAKKSPDMQKDCSIKWIKHLTDKTMEVAEAVEELKFPDRTTLTSVALAEAEAELINGREDASSIVVVITDGKPLSQDRTKLAAQKLMEKARVVWVPVGSGAPIELITELASLPKNENIIEISQFRKLGWAYWVNKLISQTCPVLI